MSLLLSRMFINLRQRYVCPNVYCMRDRRCVYYLYIPNIYKIGIICDPRFKIENFKILIEYYYTP